MDNERVRSILDRYKINEFWNFSECYYSAYIDKICGDYLYENDIIYKNSRFGNLSFFGLHAVIILGGAFLSMLRCLKYKNRSFTTEKEIDIIAFPFCHYYIRFKRLPQILAKPFRIVSHPQFHVDYLDKHYKYFKSKNILLEVFSFRWKDIATSLKLLVQNYRKLKRCSEELNSLFGIHDGKFPKIFFFVLLYRGFMEDFISNQIKSKNPHVWIFDYDFDYKYIVFNDIIHKMCPSDKTIHLMHGTFVSDTVDNVYLNPCCDYTLCSSEREKFIIEKYNKYDSIIKPLGAPLQSFNDDCVAGSITQSYDILLLLTSTHTEDITKLQKEILHQIPMQKYRVKSRYRPVSRIFDEPVLSGCLDGTVISENSSLLEDVLSAKIVISFSEDAIYECIRNNRPVIYCKAIDYKQYYSTQYESPYLKIANDSNFGEIELSLMIKEADKCNYRGDKFVIYNFGYFFLDDIKYRMDNILKEICQ